jgi:hypothetical protein
MEDALDLLMYLDEGLVRNLSSLLLSGYIDIRTTRLIQDRTLSGRAALEWREENFQENMCRDEERDGYKERHLSEGTKKEEANNSMTNLENREFIRREEEVKKIYTSFTLHSQLITGLDNSKAIKTFNNTTIKEVDISEGEYVKIKGKLTSESVNSYLDSLLTVFDSYGCDILNNLISKKDQSLLDFNVIKHLLNNLSSILKKNSTEDMILNCGDTPVVLNVNNNFFMNNNSYIYDKIDCPCSVFGKVISKASKGNCVSLLRKTTQHDYYERLLSSSASCCDLLEAKGIILPKMPRLKCEGMSLVVIPISICM